jgi:hypothetical protein
MYRPVSVIPQGVPEPAEPQTEADGKNLHQILVNAS